MKKLLCSAIVVATILACMTSAFASAPLDMEVPSEDIVLVKGTPIGSPKDEDGVLLEDSSYETRATGGLPFTMRANGVTNLLTTYNSTGKSFTGGAFDAFESTGLMIKGTVTSTLGHDVKVGACYYNPSNDTFYSVHPGYFESGVESEHWTPKLSGKNFYFSNYETYYGHITNHNGTGSVSGTLEFSVAKRPW